MKVDYKFEGSSLIVSMEGEYSLDSDKDGVPSVDAKSSNTITLNGLEMLDEAAKNSDLFKKMQDLVGKVL